MRFVIVTGGRDYDAGDTVYTSLEHLDPDVVVHGDCPTGADKFADVWARSARKICWRFPANWDELGKGAGPARNRYMCNFVAEVALHGGHEVIGLAFPGGTGTANCVVAMGKAGINDVKHVGA